MANNIGDLNLDARYGNARSGQGSNEWDLNKLHEIAQQITTELNSQRNIIQEGMDITKEVASQYENILKAQQEGSKKRHELDVKEGVLQMQYENTKDERLKKRYEKELKYIQKNKEKLVQFDEDQRDREEGRKAGQDRWNKSLIGNMVGKDSIIGKFGNAISGIIGEGKTEGGLSGFYHGLDSAIHGLANFAQGLNSTIEDIVKYKGKWDTRLNGTTINQQQISKDVSNAISASPYVKQADVMKKIDEAVDKGIAYNVEQRAFLATVSDKIATTFDAFDANLLQLIRVQQNDSTSARLGMEAALNEFLNANYQNSEYMSKVQNISGQLLQANSLLDSNQAIEFEYQVQKWLGSLYSVGLSDQTVTGLATAINQLATGDVAGTESGLGKLLIMAASKSNIDYSSMLIDGLDGSETNKLMRAMVSYLQEIAQDSQGNNVVRKQLSQLYGLQISDLTAAKNLSNLTQIEGSYQGFNAGSGNEILQSLSKSIGSRMSMGEKLANVKDNLNYTLAQGIAGSSGLYMTWYLSQMLDDLVGGIALPDIKYLGTGVNLQTSVADLMKVGALSGSIFSGIGGLMSSISNTAKGEGVWSAINSLSKTDMVTNQTRGIGLTQLDTGLGTSSSNTQTNADAGETAYQSTLNGANDEANKTLTEVKDTSTDITINDIHTDILTIYNLMNSVIEGNAVKIKYDLGVNFPI